ncbi:MAG: SET domain-containing protein [Geminicoccaceae bacterium]
MNFETQLRRLARCQYLYVAATPGKGVGIFAAHAFAAGDLIVEDLSGDYYDEVYSLADLAALGADLSQHAFQIGDDQYLLPNGNIDDLVNHSCEPNTGIQLLPEGYRMIALRDIARDEELTYDYSTYISNADEQLRCLCGAPACRGLIGPFNTLPEQRQRLYRRFNVVGAFVLAPMPVASPPFPSAARAPQAPGIGPTG